MIIGVENRQVNPSAARVKAFLNNVSRIDQLEEPRHETLPQFLSVYTTKIMEVAQTKPINVITASNWTRCGQYCTLVADCYILEYRANIKICNLYKRGKYQGIADEASNSSYRISTKANFITHKCAEDNSAVLRGEQFVIESHDKKLFFSEDKGAFWKKKRMTTWQYNNVTKQLRVHDSNTCLRWTAKPDEKLAELTFETCLDNINQKFVLYQTDDCAWNLKTADYRALSLLESELRSGVEKDVATEPKNEVSESMIPLPDGNGYNQWENGNDADKGTELRNLSYFKLVRTTFACHRFRVVNGELLPKEYNAPIFLQGDSITIQCKEDYSIKRKDGRENKTVVTCNKRELRKVVCRNGKKSDVLKYVVLSLVFICCIFLGYKFVCHLRGGGSVPEDAEADGVENNEENSRNPGDVSYKDSNNDDIVSDPKFGDSVTANIVAIINENNKTFEGQNADSNLLELCEIIPNERNSTLQYEDVIYEPDFINAKWDEDTDKSTDDSLSVEMDEDEIPAEVNNSLQPEAIGLRSSPSLEITAASSQEIDNSSDTFESVKSLY